MVRAQRGSEGQGRMGRGPRVPGLHGGGGGGLHRSRSIGGPQPEHRRDLRRAADRVVPGRPERGDPVPPLRPPAPAPGADAGPPRQPGVGPDRRRTVPPDPLPSRLRLRGGRRLLRRREAPGTRPGPAQGRRRPVHPGRGDRGLAGVGPGLRYGGRRERQPGHGDPGNGAGGHVHGRPGDLPRPVPADPVRQRRLRGRMEQVGVGRHVRARALPGRPHHVRWEPAHPHHRRCQPGGDHRRDDGLRRVHRRLLGLLPVPPGTPAPRRPWPRRGRERAGGRPRCSSRRGGRSR